MTSCSSSIKSESNPIKQITDKKQVSVAPATSEEIFLYRQIGVSYLCLARQTEIEFEKAISIAANNYALIVSNKHGGLIKEVGKEKLTNNAIYRGAILQLLDGAMKQCPDFVPDKDKKRFLKAVEEINKKVEEQNKNN